MTSWLETIAETAALYGAAVRVVTIRAEGSTPRETGAAMIVTADGLDGTIGGGALELGAIGAARSMLQSIDAEASTPSKLESEATASWRRETRDYPLGPSLGQCCGGAIKVLLEVFTSAEATFVRELVKGTESCLLVRPLKSGVPPRIIAHRREGYADLPLNALRVTRDMLSGARPMGAALIPATKSASAWFIEPLSQKRTPLYLYGAGHVGRALVRVLDGLPFEVTWVDTSEDRFPQGCVVRRSSEGAGFFAQSPQGEKAEVSGSSVTCIATIDPAILALSAPKDAFHLVMTYSHPLDLAICHAVLKNGGFGFLGLIGSRTKRARFIKRLRDLGHDQRAIDRLTCPIGIAGLPGKEPAKIAISAAAQLLQVAAAKSQQMPADASEASK